MVYGTMRLIKAQVKDYRSVRDTGPIDFELQKTIFVGPNEAGKTAILRALQQLNPPPEVTKFDALRDYPRAAYNDITTARVKPAQVTVVEGHFALEDDDKAAIDSEFHKATYVCGRHLDNTFWHRLDGVAGIATYSSIQKDLIRLVAHLDGRVKPVEGTPPPPPPSATLAELTKAWTPDTPLSAENAKGLSQWLDKNLPLLDEENKPEESRFDKLKNHCNYSDKRTKDLVTLQQRLPVFVLFSNYFRVRPIIHLEHLAQRSEQKLLDDEQYDYGNLCLLKLLGFSARQLSQLGQAAQPNQKDAAAFKSFRDTLDKRAYQLNSASVRLTDEIRKIWNPKSERAEADRLRVTADGQYLKVVVEDDLGVEIELDQRSEGIQWLVSFFVVFFAEAIDKHKNAILLLDEPGLSLHALKQREFRETVTRLSERNQTIYTTHSPFLVGPDELDLVRVVEMNDRRTGTKVHTTISAGNSAALLPLQEALGYDLAQSLFTSQRNLVLEGLTDYWYIEATASLLRDAATAELNEKISLVPASSAGKVVYFATILHSNNLKVAALLDSDTAGDSAAQQDTLVHALGNKRILRTKDAYKGPVKKPEVEDLLRDTLVNLAKTTLGWDVTKEASAQKSRPIVDIFEAVIPTFSKYKLAKAYLKWTQSNDASQLTIGEQSQWIDLIGKINAALK